MTSLLLLMLIPFLMMMGPPVIKVRKGRVGCFVPFSSQFSVGRSVTQQIESNVWHIIRLATVFMIDCRFRLPCLYYTVGYQ